MKEFWEVFKPLCIPLVIIFLLGGVAVFVQAKMESATFNKLTGAQTTWWDAMWVELRVMEAPKENK